MSKKKTGLLIALGAVLGAAAAGASYYFKYRSFSDELDQDFHDYEEDEMSTEPCDCVASCSESANRTYISLDGAKVKTSEDAKPAAQEDAADAAAEKTNETEAAKETKTAAQESSGAVIEEETEEAGE